MVDRGLTAASSATGDRVVLLDLNFSISSGVMSLIGFLPIKTMIAFARETSFLHELLFAFDQGRKVPQ
jgi:hypothetical protein